MRTKIGLEMNTVKLCCWSRDICILSPELSPPREVTQTAHCPWFSTAQHRGDVTTHPKVVRRGCKEAMNLRVLSNILHQKGRAGQMVQQIRAIAALPEDSREVLAPAAASLNYL